MLCIHHRLGGYTSHHVHEALALQQELRRRSIRLAMFVNKIAEPRVVAELDARAVLDDPTFRAEWSFEERSRRFVAMLHAEVDRFVKEDDRLLLTVSTQLEAHALSRWMKELPRRRKPWIVVLFLSDRWNRAGRDEFERQIAEFRVTAAEIASLDADDARRMIFCAVTAPLAQELSTLLGTNVSVSMMPQGYAHLETSPPPRPANHLSRVAILGGTRREKGSHRIPDIVRACRTHVPVEFLIHLMNNTLTPDEERDLGLVANEPDVTILQGGLTPEEYAAAVQSSDVFLFPYEEIPYRQRTSGVFAEAVAVGKPVVVTPGTWLAQQIDAGRAAGTIAGDHTPDSIARAIAQCVEHLDAHRASAERVRDAFKNANSMAAFIDFVETTIASRAVPRPKRSFWPF